MELLTATPNYYDIGFGAPSGAYGKFCVDDFQSPAKPISDYLIAPSPASNSDNTLNAVVDWFVPFLIVFAPALIFSAPKPIGLNLGLIGLIVGIATGIIFGYLAGLLPIWAVILLAILEVVLLVGKWGF